MRPRPRTISGRSGTMLTAVSVETRGMIDLDYQIRQSLEVASYGSETTRVLALRLDAIVGHLLHERPDWTLGTARLRVAQEAMYWIGRKRQCYWEAVLVALWEWAEHHDIASSLH